MYKFNIEIPKEVITETKHDEIDFSLLENMIIVGLMGYAKSGKDFIAKTFIEDYGYQRVAFADNIKKEMNLYIKESVYNDVLSRDFSFSWGQYGINSFNDIDFFTENLELKKIIRPYIMWYGETLRDINGKFYWINKAFSEDAKDMDKVVLSDVRRVAELDIFRNSNEFNKRELKSLTESGASSSVEFKTNNFSTLLFEVSQKNLIDNDVLTTDTIRVANEDWIVDDKFFVNPSIPGEKNYRTKAMLQQIKKVTTKFGIEKPKTWSYEQKNIFQEIKENN